LLQLTCGLATCNIVGRINEVTLHRAGLVLRWVSICGYAIFVCNQARHGGQLSLAIPPWVGAAVQLAQLQAHCLR